MAFPSCLPRGEPGDEPFPLEPTCSCGLIAGAPGCGQTLHPYLDEASLAVVGQAVASLACARGSGPGDAGAALSCLASLVAEAQSRLPDAVADARDQGYTWAEIAARLASSAATARRRYGGYACWRAASAMSDD
jgi:hypothetical protein